VRGEEAYELRIVAIMLEASKLQTWSQISSKFSSKFGSQKDYQLFRAALGKLRDNGTLIEFSPEYEAIETAVSVSHPTHGDLEPYDLEFTGMDEFLSLGPASVNLINERSSVLAEFAAELGLANALDRLRRLPIDSRKWTGLPSAFVFNDAVKSRCVSLLEEAKSELSNERQNSKVDHAHDLITAALVLAQTNEPEPELVWLIVQRLAAVIGLTQAVIGLQNLFKVN